MHRKIRDDVDGLSQRKADVLRILSKWSSEEDPEDHTVSKQLKIGLEGFGPISPPLEEFMHIPGDEGVLLRRKRFFADIRKGDIVYGAVTSKQLSGIVVKLLACQWSQLSRSLDDLGPLKGSQSRSQAFCPADHMSATNSRQDPVDRFEIKDTIRAVVVSVNPEQEKLVLSLLQTDSMKGALTLPLGVSALEDLPKYYRQIVDAPPRETEDLATYLRKQREFDNPVFLGLARDHLDIPEMVTSKRWFSLLPGYCGKKINPEDSAEQLTHHQSCRWSMKNVEDGVKLMKDGDIPASLLALNKAVEMNKLNVEAFVARGALYAKKEDYHRAIKDFEEAIKQKPNHRNARKYLADTFYALGRKFEKDEPERAIRCYNDALRWDPQFDEAFEAQEQLLKRDRDQKTETAKKLSENKKLSTAEKLRRMLHDTNNGKSASKRQGRARSGSKKSSDDGGHRSRKHSSNSNIKSSEHNGDQPDQEDVSNHGSRSGTKTTVSRAEKGDVRVSSGTERTSVPSKAIPPPTNDFDLDALESELERFRAEKKAQILASNKDIHKRTFL